MQDIKSIRVEDILNQKNISIIVKASSKENAILGVEDNSLKVSIAAPANKDKANKEVIRFFSKLLNKKVRIKSGLKSRKKIIEVV
ncbi:MAG: DUF167 domain-containing protein [Candidatus Woesearchaeota archaeon]